MPALRTYRALLDESCGVDRWEDVLLDEAVAALAGLDDSGWHELRAEVPHRPAAWRARCAQTLGDADPSRSVELLLGLVRDGDPEVREAAADSLHEAVRSGAVVVLDPAAREAVHALASGPGVGAVVARALLAHVDAQGSGTA